MRIFAIYFKNVFYRLFSHLGTIFGPKSREVTHKLGYIGMSFCLNRFFALGKRRSVDVRKGKTSLMSISAAVQELFRKTEGK